MIAKIVVPWRGGDPVREANWAFARLWWERFGFEIIVVEHGGNEPFNRAWCINEGARRAVPWDVLIMIDADVTENDDWQVTKLVTEAWRTGKLVVGHTEGRDLTEKGTQWVLDHRAFDWNTQVAARRPECLSRVNAMRADLFERLGGLDGRFLGYGHEDTSLYAAARAASGGLVLVPGRDSCSWHLYHEPMLPKSRTTPEWVAGKDLALRYLAAEKQGWPAVQAILDERTPDERYDPPFPTPVPEMVKASVELVVITSGRREYLEQTLASAAEHLQGHGAIDRFTMIDDSGDSAFGAYLDETYPLFTIIHHLNQVGYSVTMQQAREHIRDSQGPPYVFWLEDDFVFNRDISLDEMATLLTKDDIAQVVLLRQAWRGEVAAGGIVQQHPESYTYTSHRGIRYLRHQRFYSSNPNLSRRSLFDYPWPEGAHTESRFGKGLVTEGYSFAFLGWGSEDVRHIGEIRGGHGY